MLSRAFALSLLLGSQLAYAEASLPRDGGHAMDGGFFDDAALDAAGFRPLDDSGAHPDAAADAEASDSTAAPPPLDASLPVDAGRPSDAADLPVADPKSCQVSGAAPAWAAIAVGLLAAWRRRPRAHA